MTDQELTQRAKKAREIYLKYRSLFDRYHGGMPLGAFVATAQWESNGRHDVSGDDRLGEYGIFQISEHIEDAAKVPRGTRMNLEANFYLAGWEYNTEAVRLTLKYPRLFFSGTTDQWLTSRLVFSIGRSGTDRVIKAANPSPGNVYKQLVAWAERTGAMPLGSQSAAKVVHRIQSKLWLWEIGRRAGLSIAPGVPFVPSPPFGITPYVPKDIKGKISVGQSFGIATAALLAAGAWYYLKA